VMEVDADPTGKGEGTSAAGSARSRGLVEVSEGCERLRVVARDHGRADTLAWEGKQRGRRGRRGTQQTRLPIHGRGGTIGFRSRVFAGTIFGVDPVWLGRRIVRPDRTARPGLSGAAGQSPTARRPGVPAGVLRSPASCRSVGAAGRWLARRDGCLAGQHRDDGGQEHGTLSGHRKGVVRRTLSGGVHGRMIHRGRVSNTGSRCWSVEGWRAPHFGGGSPGRVDRVGIVWHLCGGRGRIDDNGWRTATAAGRTTTRKRLRSGWHRACSRGGHGGGGGGGTSLLHPSTSSHGDVSTPGLGDEPRRHLRRVAGSGSGERRECPGKGKS